MKTSEVLRIAKDYLPNDCRIGICSALDDARYANSITTRDADKVKTIVTDRIEPFGYATTWLAWQMVFKDKPVGTNGISQRAWAMLDKWHAKHSAQSKQAWRHAWVDQMIKEFEAKGD